MPHGHPDFEFSANVKTLAANNLVIDKLTQGAFTPRQQDLRNDNGVASPTAPPGSETGVAYKGKFFPRGARGVIYALYVYCKRTGAGPITLSYAPFPGIGAVGSVTITPGADWDWKGATVYKMWSYDSLFIWISACGADVSWGYDTASPPDQFESVDSGVTWVSVVKRLFLYASLTGLTVGDVPVSGTINNIQIPTTVSAALAQTLSWTISEVDAKYITLDGPGRLLWVMWYVDDTTSRDRLQPRILADGQNAMPAWSWFTTWWDYMVELSKAGFFFGKYDTTNNRYLFICMLPIEFKRQLQIGCYPFGGFACDVSIGYAVSKIT